jgi:transcription elongation factor Elf1
MNCPFCNGTLRCEKKPQGWVIWCAHCGAWAQFDCYWILEKSNRDHATADRLRTAAIAAKNSR